MLLLLHEFKRLKGQVPLLCKEFLVCNGSMPCLCSDWGWQYCLLNGNSFEKWKKKSSLCEGYCVEKQMKTLDADRHLCERPEAADRTRPYTPEKRRTRMAGCLKACFIKVFSNSDQWWELSCSSDTSLDAKWVLRQITLICPLYRTLCTPVCEREGERRMNT